LNNDDTPKASRRGSNCLTDGKFSTTRLDRGCEQRIKANGSQQRCSCTKQREENGVQSCHGELSGDEITQGSRVEDGNISVRLPTLLAPSSTPSRRSVAAPTTGRGARRTPIKAE
jgi:hypothetical protein